MAHIILAAGILLCVDYIELMYISTQCVYNSMWDRNTDQLPSRVIATENIVIILPPPRLTGSPFDLVRNTLEHRTLTGLYSTHDMTLASFSVCDTQSAYSLEK